MGVIRRFWWYPTFVESGYLNWWCADPKGGSSCRIDIHPSFVSSGGLFSKGQVVSLCYVSAVLDSL